MILAAKIHTLRVLINLDAVKGLIRSPCRVQFAANKETLATTKIKGNIGAILVKPDIHATTSWHQRPSTSYEKEWLFRIKEMQLLLIDILCRINDDNKYIKWIVINFQEYTEPKAKFKYQHDVQEAPINT